MDELFVQSTFMVRSDRRMDLPLVEASFLDGFTISGGFLFRWIYHLLNAVYFCRLIGAI